MPPAIFDLAEPTVIGAQPTVTEESQPQGVFKGYYERLREDRGSQTCNTLVVVGGHEGLITYFKALVTYGNSVNTINKDGNLQINLPWSEMPESDRSRILASTPNQPVQIELKKKIPEGKGASTCFSFLSFVRVL